MKYPMLITRAETDVPLKHVEAVVMYVGIALSPGLVDMLNGYVSFFKEGRARDERLQEITWEDTILPAVWFCGREPEDPGWFDLEEILTDDEIALYEDNNWVIAEVRRTQIPSNCQLLAFEQHTVRVTEHGIEWWCKDTRTGMNLFSMPVELSVLEEACQQ